MRKAGWAGQLHVTCSDSMAGSLHSWEERWHQKRRPSHRCPYRLLNYCTLVCLSNLTLWHFETFYVILCAIVTTPLHILHLLHHRGIRNGYCKTFKLSNGQTHWPLLFLEGPSPLKKSKIFNRLKIMIVFAEGLSESLEWYL